MDSEKLFDLSGKLALITGASRGIGAEAAKTLARFGARVILSSRKREGLDGIAQEITEEGFEAMVRPCHNGDLSQINSLFEELDREGESVDILVNNAGVSQRSFAIDTAPHVYTDLLNTDLLAPIWLTQLQLQRMADAGGAHIVAISSVAGRIGAPLRTAYCAAKHGLIGYMDALRTEVSIPHNIHITNVLPGSVATDVARNALTADGTRRGTSDAHIDAGDSPHDCAAAIIEAVAHNVPELIFAHGMELEFATLRHDNPGQYFTMAAQLGAQLVVQGLPE